ncbi:kinase-like domain-containing protein [Melanogaster broomeanus]|nr:kinase-like domain-containing protein [Melanogaster broomeanus]
MQTSQARPIGPRTRPRAQSPLLTETRPLQIRKASVDHTSLRPPSPASQLSSSPTPSRPQLPGTLLMPRANGVRPRLQLGISAGFGGVSDYYAGPASIPPGLDGENPGGATLQTARPPEPSGVSDNSIEQLVAILDKASVDSESYTPTEETSTRPALQKWSDSLLEELSRLGEGQGGAVHKHHSNSSSAKYLSSSNAKHINVIQFYGAYMSPSSSEIKVMMEFCAGGSLEAVGQRIKERGARIGESVTGRIAEGVSISFTVSLLALADLRHRVLQGLAYLHSLRTIHRDIKPANILLTGEGVVRLGDFGVSGELVMSVAGTFTGTSFYMAPERISGKEYSIRADVWSTGITILELVKNQYPFPDDLTSIELLPPQLTDEPDVTWSEEMKHFIRQTLIVDHTMRPTPKEMLSHPWIVSIMKKEVPMARWIREVWGWRSTQSSNASGSRPSSSRGPRVSTPP